MWEKILEGLQKLASVAKWNNALPVAVILISFATAFVVVTNPTQVTQLVAPKVKGNDLTEMSKETTALSESFVRQNDHVDLMYVIAVDQKKNRRTSVGRFFADLEIQMLIEAQDKIVPRQTVTSFTTIDNVVVNTQMDTLSRGDFACGPTSESGLFELYPGLKGKLKYTCRQPIPPLYGQLAGYIVIHTREQLDQKGMDRLREKAELLALKIFATDVRKNPTLYEQLS